jgi:hypothetical protein
MNRIGGIMVGVIASCAVDRGFESRLGQHKDYTIGFWCFPAKHAALRRKSKDWLAWNQNNVSEWSDMSTCGLVSVNTIKIQLSMLVQDKANPIIIISLKINLFSPYYSWTIDELALNNNHSLMHVIYQIKYSFSTLFRFKIQVFELQNE